jgi:hypothetical protein
MAALATTVSSNGIIMLPKTSMRTPSRIALIVSIVLLGVCVLLVIQARSYFLGGVRVRGPLSAEQILRRDDVFLPVYAIAPDADPLYAQLETTYYFFPPSGPSGEAALHTYFTIVDADGRVVRVARLAVCNVCLPGGYNYVTGEQVPVAWSSDGSGWLCRVPPGSGRADPIPGSEYETCLVWRDSEGNNCQLDTVWPEDAIETFVDTLVVVESIENP